MPERILPSPETQVRFFRFLVVGAGSALVQFGSLHFLKQGQGAELAFSCSFILSTGTHYLLNRFWALRSDRRDSWKQFGEYLATAVLSYGINLLLFKVCHELLGLGVMGSAALALPPSTLFVFLVLNNRVFRRRLARRRPAVFLDRDGTLNLQVLREGKPYPPDSLEAFQLFPGVPEACRRLHEAGYVLVVATNQPDVGRGTQKREVVEAMHAGLRAWVPQIARIETCYDPGRGEASRRRKPEPGMVLDAAEALGIDLTRSWMVGDRWRDIDCGKRAGLRTVFIDFGYDETLRERPDLTAKSFTEAAEAILSVDAGGPTAEAPAKSTKI